MANLTPKKKWSQVPDLISEYRGNVSAIARALRMPRSSVHAKIHDDAKLKSLLADERERMLDNAEDKLGLAVDSGEAWAVCFTLKTQGQGRGYVEKQRIQHENPDGSNIIPKIIVEIVNGSITTDSENQN